MLSWFSLFAAAFPFPAQQSDTLVDLAALEGRPYWSVSVLMDRASRTFVAASSTVYGTLD